MHELEAAEFYLVSPILDTMTYGLGVTASVIERNFPGRVFVDDRTGPTITLVCRKGGGYFLVGDPGNEQISGLLSEAFFESLGEPFGLQVFPETWEGVMDRLLGDQVKKKFRKQFQFSPSARKQDWEEQVPPGFRIERMDGALIERIGIRIGFWGSVDTFLKYGFGFAMLREDHLASKCYTAFVGGGEYEIQINTEEDFEGQGLGTLTASAFVEHCIRNAVRPAWSCDLENRASAAVARKVGFEEIGDSPIYLWLD